MKVDQNNLLEMCRQTSPKRIAVIGAGDFHVLQALHTAYMKGIAQPILCGDIESIDSAARLHNIDISAFEIIETDTLEQAVSIAASLIRQGRADMIMKGLVQTGDLLRAVLDSKNGLRGDGIISHVAVVDSPVLDRTVLLTDCAIVTYPDLKTKIKLINNAVAVAKAIGFDKPLVAPVAAIEIVNPDMPATLDAAALTVMNQRGQIKDCIVDGPLALDCALSLEAATHKRLSSPAAGKADILLFHNIEAANSTCKSLATVGGGLMGGVVMGANVPLIITSRSDSPESKLLSILLACATAQAANT